VIGQLILKNNLRIGLFLMLLFGINGGSVLAEPQFGGDVSGVVACTCGSNAGGHYFIVGDPHGDESGGSASYVSGPNTDVRDCSSIADGEEILGMHNENDEECRVQIGNACVLVGTGKGVDMYGTSPSTCPTGLDGDASGDGGKVEMITPDGRTADGGDYDDGGPSGGPSQATQHDAHLATVDGVRYDGSGGGEHMVTPDHQDYEGSGSSHMETADHRNYEGRNDTTMKHSGNDSGYSSAGGGRKGYGDGSVGGSVGSGGLQSPVVLGDKDVKKDKIEKEIQPKVGINRGINNTTAKKGGISRMFFALLLISGAGYFIFKSLKKVLK
jgi:hypothetical protein